MKLNYFFAIGCTVLVTFFASGFLFGENYVGAVDEYYDSVIVKLQNNQLYKLNVSSLEEYVFLMHEYSQQPEVVYVEPNVLVEMSMLPNDPEYFRQWYLPHVQVPEAWNISTGSNTVVVAVLDTGVDIDHPDLRSNIWINDGERPYDLIDNDGNGLVDDFYGWNFVQQNNDVKPLLNGANSTAVHHGTVVAGVIGARGNNNEGVVGINWQVKIMPIKVLDNLGQGDTFAVTQAINYAVEKGADIINLSFVGASYSQSLQQAIKRAYDNDVVVVAAAGNEDLQGKNLNTDAAYPVCNDGADNVVIGVAALDENDSLTSFSNYGSKCIDISAPGRLFHSTISYEPDNEEYTEKYGSGWSGTSVATPVVSGIAALIKAINPELKAAQVRNILVNTAKDVSNANESQFRSGIGSGLVQAQAAVKAAAATLQGGSTQSTEEEFLIFGPGPGGGPHVRVLDIDGNVLGQFFAYEETFRGGVHVTSADVDGDGTPEIITAPGPGREPEIKVFDISGNLQQVWYAYSQQFRGGVHVTSADVDGDGTPEIITAPQSQGGPHVRVFNAEGVVVSQFMAYVPHFRGGVSIASLDMNGDGIAEIVTGAGPSGGPHVRVFDQSGSIRHEFMSYAPTFYGGITVAAGDIDNNGTPEIITAPQSQGGPHIRIFSQTGMLKSQWFAGDNSLRTGMSIAVGDINGDGLRQLLIGYGQGLLPEVKIYDWLGNINTTILAYNPVFAGGVHVSVLKP